MELVAKSSIEGNKATNMAKIMVEAGYSDRTARAPTKLTKSQGWLELLDEYFPDDELNARLKALMDHPDAPIQLRALENAFKLKGRFVDKVVHSLGVQEQYAQVSYDSFAEPEVLEAKKVEILPPDNNEKEAQKDQ